MIKQRENDWNKRYRDSDTPWEETSPSVELQPILDKYTNGNESIFEIGCGLGVNAIWLANKGYNVEATDISDECIKLAQQRELPANLKLYQFDILNNKANKKFDIIFDKGCFHSFLNQDAYNIFAQRVSDLLSEGGLWINISGNADNPDDPVKRKELSFPRLSLKNIVDATETNFEILEVKRSRFGVKNDFHCWLSVFKKRQYFYE